MKGNTNDECVSDRNMSKKDDIVKGLINVMKIDDYHLITVTQIAQEARVGRKTFYRYFSNKEAVLEYAMQKLFEDYASHLDNYYSSQMERLIFQHFNFWSQHRLFLSILYKSDLMFYVFKHYQTYVQMLNAAYMRNLKYDQKEKQYANAITTGMFWSLLYTWVERGLVETPQELADMYIQLKPVT